jgi:hypothetical protein
LLDRAKSLSNVFKGNVPSRRWLIASFRSRIVRRQPLALADVIWPSIEWYVAGHSVPYRPGSHTAPVVHTTSKVSYYEFARLSGRQPSVHLFCDSQTS